MVSTPLHRCATPLRATPLTFGRNRNTIKRPENYHMNESAEESIKRILNGEFSIQDEAEIVENIRKKLSLPLTHEKIREVLMDCIDSDLNVEESKTSLNSVR